MRFAALIAFSACALVAVPAAAQNEAPYPFEADTVTATTAPEKKKKLEAKKPAAKKPEAPQLPPARPAVIAAEPAKTETKPDTAKPEAAEAETVRLPLARPAAIAGPAVAPAKPELEKAPVARQETAKGDVPKTDAAKDPLPGADVFAGIPEYGWTVMVDPATGVRLGLPTRMMPHVREAPRGTRWASRRGEMLVETFRINDPNLKLAALFEKEKSEPAARRVEYSVLRSDSFYIRGLQGLKKFSVRATIRNGEIRGFTLMFDQAMEGIVAQVSEAMVSAFSPFPERGAPFAALARSVEYGNGLVVSAQGHIVTDRKLTEGCQVIVAAGLGDTARIADDRDSGLALLRFYGARQMTPMRLDVDAPKPGDLTLTGIPDPKQHEGRRSLTEIKARLVDGSRIELRQPVPMAGFSGAAALGADGRFLGMMKLRSVVLASAEPVLPPVRLIDAATIREFLSAQNVAPEPAAAGDAKASIVRIICVRN